MKHRKCTALLLMRIVLGGIFIFHGLQKLMSNSEGMANFIGGAFHDLGLTFLSASQWLFVLGLGEVILGTLIVLGLLVSFAAPVLIVIMLGAMKSKGWSWDAIELDVVLAGIALALTVSGSGSFGLDHLLCKKCCGKATCSKGGCDVK